MSNWFDVDHLDVERLLSGWRWLCPKPMALVARNAFGDLFLRDEIGEVYRLDVAIGKLIKIADSEAQFRELAAVKRQDWFAETDELAAAARGLIPNATQCIGFSVPLVFREGGSPDTTASSYALGFCGDRRSPCCQTRLVCETLRCSQGRRYAD